MSARRLSLSALQAVRSAPGFKCPLVILGVDTAIRRTGYGVLEMSAPGRFKILDCGVIKNAQDLPHSQCLRRLAGGVRELAGAFHPATASIEDAFIGRNVKTGMTLSLARGAVICALAELDIPVYQYSPSTAKRSAVGRGDASKEQVALMMAALCGIDVKDIPSDSTDALALAVCHGNILARPELAGLVAKAL